MADAVTTQILFDGPKEAVIKFTNISDATGESAVTKVTPSSLAALANGKACSRVAIKRIFGNTSGMGFQLLWDADTDVVAWVAGVDCAFDHDFPVDIANNAGTGITGLIKLTTFLHAANDTYCFTLVLAKS